MARKFNVKSVMIRDHEGRNVKYVVGKDGVEGIDYNSMVAGHGRPQVKVFWECQMLEYNNYPEAVLYVEEGSELEKERGDQ